MVKYPNYLAGSQDDINKRFLEMLLKAEAGDASAIQALADKVGSESTANTILYRIKAAETAIGKASGEGAGGILKDVADLKTAVGSADTDDGSLKKRCKTIETAIGDEDTSGTILYRIKALEDG